MVQGARTGLEARGQDISQMDAGNRLRYSYDALAANQAMERQKMQNDAQNRAAQALYNSQQDAIVNAQNQQKIDYTKAYDEGRITDAETKMQASQSLLNDQSSGNDILLSEIKKGSSVADAVDKVEKAGLKLSPHILGLALSAEQAKAKQAAQPDIKAHVDIDSDKQPRLVDFAPDNPLLSNTNLVNPSAAALLGTNYSAALSGQTQKMKPVRVKDKTTGKTFIYKGNPADIPTNQYDILQ